MPWWLNGEPCQQWPLGDRSMLYGDGLFTTLAIRQAKAVLWPYHVQRLQQGCQRLQLAFADWSSLESQLEELLVGGVTDAVLKIMLTRGLGTRGYYAPSSSPNLLLQLQPWPVPDPSCRAPARLRWCQMRLSENPQLAGIKHLNRLEQVLARQEWQEEFDEGLLQDKSGRVIEAVSANLFVLKQGCWLTPKLTHSGVAGVMRQYLLQQMPQWGISVQQAELSPQDVQQADELILTNSLTGVWPVASLASQSYGYQQGMALKQRVERALEWR